MSLCVALQMRCALALLATLAMGTADAAECQIGLSESNVDYGRLDRTELEGSSGPDHDVVLGRRHLMLSVTCPLPASMALRFVAQSAQEGGYKFARTGMFTILMRQAILDGRTVSLATGGTLGDSPQGAAESQPIEPGRSVVAVAEGGPARGRQFIALLEIQTSIPRKAMRVSGETLLEGAGRLELLSR